MIYTCVGMHISFSLCDLMAAESKVLRESITQSICTSDAALLKRSLSTFSSLTNNCRGQF